MIRFPLPFVTELAIALERLAYINEGPINRFGADIYQAQYHLDNLLSTSVLSGSLRSSLPLARDLLFVVRSIAGKFSTNDLFLTSYEAWSVTSKYQSFKVAFYAEIGAFSSYFVTQKAGYDVHSLLEDPERIFPEGLRAKVPEAIFDITEMSKCLAFELGTAAAFHAFRAAEAVLRRYYAHLTGGAAPPKVRTIRVYVKAMRSVKTGDEKVLSALDHLADLHRNPLIHPGDVLTVSEAVDVLGMVRSVISAMLSRLPEVPGSTQAPVGLLGTSAVR